MRPLNQAYVNLQAYARRRGMWLRVDQDEFGNIEVGVFAEKPKSDSEPFCASCIDNQNDFEWVDYIKHGIRDYMRAEDECAASHGTG